MSVGPALSCAVLESGDQLTQAEFHRLYQQTPEDFRAELIGGIVYVASPLRRRHGVEHLTLGSTIYTYMSATPGVEAGDNATVLLGDDAEPQPDLYLRILSEYGGQSQVSGDDYIVGPPELIIEIAHSTRAIDLHAKHACYRQYGVREYLVVCLAENEIRWFDLTVDDERHAETDRIVRIHTFPGLWIDVAALFAGDAAQLLATLQTGLATPEHAAFVTRLCEARSQSRST